jgi:hypothetical protein
MANRLHPGEGVMSGLRIAVLLLTCTTFASYAEAHHEALFGPQSALLSGERVFTAQVFSRQTGPKGERTQETTVVFGGGFSPKRLPVSLSVVMPFSVISGFADSRVGLENAIVAARYRVDLAPLSRALGSDCYALGVGGIELPTGTIDHRFGKGPAAVIAAGSVGLERRPFSVIGYGLLHRYAEYDQLQESGNRFLGGGFAWTPIDREQEGRLFSLQFGVSHEATFRAVLNGRPLDDTGGWALVAHPTIVWETRPNVMFFALTSFPLTDHWDDAADHERFRVGGGATVSFGR